MGLNLSNEQIARELDLDKDDLADMAGFLRKTVNENSVEELLEGEVEFDEVYIKAGHKGQPDKVLSAGRPPRCRALKGAPGRGTLASEKPPVLGMIQRSGCVWIRMLENVRIKTIEPLITGMVKKGTHIYTDEYCIYNWLEKAGYRHKTVNHSKGVYARAIA